MQAATVKPPSGQTDPLADENRMRGQPRLQDCHRRV